MKRFARDCGGMEFKLKKLSILSIRCFFALALLGFMALTSLAQSDSILDEIPFNQPVGSALTKTECEGKAIILSLGRWNCGNCRSFAANFEQLADNYDIADDVVFLYFDLDQPLSDIQKYLDETGYMHVSMYQSNWNFAWAMQEKYNLISQGSIPWVFYFDKHGNIVKTSSGPQRHSELTAYLSSVTGLSLDFNGNAAPNEKSNPPAVGDPIGDVVYTDITAYINGQPIPISNIDGYAHIVAEDLQRYGFDVVWNGKERVLKVERNQTKATHPLPAEKIPAGKKPGDIRAKYVLSAIKVYLSGEPVDSYSINGYMFIDFESLKKYGTVKWDNSARRLDCELKSIEK